MRKRLRAMTDNGRFHTAEALASARTRVTERAFNCKHLTQDVVVCAERIACSRKNVCKNNDL